ncbi:hypothetical protein GIB67_004031 [Kingdonia uniflora]|uniref:Cytochrome P450 n=1 Tax=Kingdonia uniflora TaxID=39325 RepID=A0A7J7NR45_9MAGN|nr:hypothetical protein GIB67_004031 [Kingdonia uniflora]
MFFYILFPPLYTFTINFHHLLIFLFVLTPTVLLLFQWRSRRRIFPPGPRGLPFIGNLHQLGELPHRSLQHLSSIYGPLMFLQLGSIPTLIISSADIARELFKNFDRVFSGRPHLYGLTKLSYGCSNITSAPYGEFWKEVKKITVLELLSAKKVQSFRAVREEELALVMSFITTSSESGPIDLSEMLPCLVNNIVCRVTFSKKYSEVGGGKSRIDAILRDTQTLLGEFALADFFPRLEWIHKFDGLKAKLNKIFMELDKFYDEVIEEHVKRKKLKLKPEHEDLVDVLLRISSDPNQTITLTRDQIKGVLTDVFFAGTDASSTTVVWTMTELIKNPKEMDKAQEEVRQILGTKDMVREEDLSQLNYLKLVIKESMRLHPPAPLLVPRETIENCTFHGFYIPAKTRVLVNAAAISRDPKIWENPGEFKPDRFLDNPIDFKGNDFEFIPFGAGRRGCPGINFAILLIELILANLLHRFDWELPHGLNREDVDMEEAIGITMHKKISLRLVANVVNVV